MYPDETSDFVLFDRMCYDQWPWIIVIIPMYKFSIH